MSELNKPLNIPLVLSAVNDFKYLHVEHTMALKIKNLIFFFTSNEEHAVHFKYSLRDI